MGAPGYWDDQEAAARTSAAHARAQRRLETFRAIERAVGELDDLAELAEEDEEIEGELEGQLSAIESRLAEFAW